MLWILTFQVVVLVNFLWRNPWCSDEKKKHYILKMFLHVWHELASVMWRFLAILLWFILFTRFLYFELYLSWIPVEPHRSATVKAEMTGKKKKNWVVRLLGILCPKGSQSPKKHAFQHIQVPMKQMVNEHLICEHKQSVCEMFKNL